MAISAPATIGQVSEITGTVYVREPSGELVQLMEGMPVYQDQVIVAGSGGSLSIQLINGELFTLGHDSMAKLDEDVVTQAEIDEAIASEEDIQDIIAKILEGRINELEETAAGEEGGEPSSSLQSEFGIQSQGNLGDVNSGHETGTGNNGFGGVNNENGSDRGFEFQFASFAVGSSTITPVVDTINVASFTDNFVNGVQYETSSNLFGLTGDQGPAGSFAFRPGDTITFKIGDVIIGEFSADAVQGSILFLQDVAGTELSDLNSMYVENMAIFLQALDSDLTDSTDDGVLQTNDLQNAEEAFANNIEITPEMRDAFVGYVDPSTGQPLNLATSGKQMISDALAHVNIEFTAESERDDSNNGENVFETIAMEHVTNTIENLAGDRTPEEMDAREVDTINIPGSVIEYNYDSANGVISFSTDDLLEGAVGQQVIYDNLIVSNVSLAEAFESIGELVDLGDGNYEIQLADGVDPHDLEGLTIDYRVEDWTVSKEVSSTTLDTFKSHLSAEINDVSEDVGYNEFTLNSTLTFDYDTTLKIDFTSSSLSDQLGKAIAEYADDYPMPLLYSNDGGETWQSVALHSMTLEGGVATPTFAMTLDAGNDALLIRVPIFDDALIEETEYFDANVSGNEFYDEHLEFAIFDNDADSNPNNLPLLSIDYVYATEGQGYATYTVTLSSPSTETVTVDYDATSLAAIAGVDFADVAGTLTFAPGETTQTIQVPIVDDAEVEDIEMAFINIKNPNNALIGDGQGSLRIFDNDGEMNLAVTLDIDPITADSILNAVEVNGPVMVTGTVSAQDLAAGVVVLTIDGNVYSTPIDENGQFAVEVPGSILEADLDHVVDGSVIAYDSNGQKGTDTDTEAYTVDTVAAATITLDDVTTDDVVNAAEYLSNVAITGTTGGDVKEGDTVTLTINNKAFTGQVDANNNFSISVPGTDLVADSDKTIEATVTATDLAGNTATASDSDEYTIDLGASAFIIVDRITADGIINAAEAAGTVAVTGRVGGDAVEGDTISFTVNDTPYTGTVLADKTFSVDVAGSDLAADTSFKVTVSGEDDVGNPFSASVNSTHQVDLEAEASITLTADITADDIINIAEYQGSVDITGTTGGDVKEGDTVTLTINDKTFTGQVDANNNFSISVPGEDLAADIDNTIEASVTATDDVGNTKTVTGTESYSVDLSASAFIIVDRITSDGVINAAEAAGTVAVTGRVGGDAVEGDTISFTVNDTPYTGTVLADKTFSVDVAGSDLAVDTSFRVTVSGEDDAGNPFSASFTSSHTVDIEALPPVITNMTDDSDASNYSVVTLHGTGEPGAMITLYSKEGSTTGGNHTNEPRDFIVVAENIIVAQDGTWSVEIQGFENTPVNDNEFFKAIQQDTAGNSSTESNTVHYWHGSWRNVQTEVEDDFILMGSSNDSIRLNDNDLNDRVVVDGGSGTDTAIFPGSHSNYVITKDASGNIIVTELTGSGDVNELRDFESIRFGDGTYDVAAESFIPKAYNDAVDILEDETVTIMASTLVANDRDFDGDDLSIASVSNAVNGTVSLDENGNVVFIPDANYSGTASFSYQVKDANGLVSANKATVTINVEAVADAPLLDLDIDEATIVEGNPTLYGTTSLTGDISQWGTINNGVLTAHDNLFTVTASSDKSNASVGFDGNNRATSHDNAGLGVAGHGDSNQIESTKNEALTFLFNEVMSGKTVIGLSGLGGHYKETHKADAKAHWVAFKNGQQVASGDVRQDLNNSDGDGQRSTNSFTVGVAFDEIVLTADANINSNHSVQFIEAIPLSYEYSLDMHATLTDTDGSETLSMITLSHLPNGVTVEGDGVTDNNNGTFTVELDITTGEVEDNIHLVSSRELSSAELSDIRASVSSTESSNSDTATKEVNEAGDSFLYGSDDDVMVGTVDNDEFVIGGDNIVLQNFDIDHDVLNLSEVIDQNVTLDENNLSNYLTIHQQGDDTQIIVDRDGDSQTTDDQTTMTIADHQLTENNINVIDDNKIDFTNDQFDTTEEPY